MKKTSFQNKIRVLWSISSGFMTEIGFWGLALIQILLLLIGKFLLNIALVASLILSLFYTLIFEILLTYVITDTIVLPLYWKYFKSLNKQKVARRVDKIRIERIDSEGNYW